MGGGFRLRVLLIRKEFKLLIYDDTAKCGLRVLLIRKEFKLKAISSTFDYRLRVLLIRKEFKHLRICEPP